MHLSLRLQNALIVNAVLFLAYYSLLIWSNNTYLYQLYEYMGASARQVDLPFVLMLPLLAIYSSFLCGSKITTPGDVIVAMMVLILFPHAIILSGANSFSPDANLYSGIGLAVIAGVSLAAFANKVHFRERAEFSDNAMKYLWVAAWINMAVLLVMCLKSADYFSFNYSGQYVRRALAREVFSSGGPLNYIISIGTQAIFPVLFAWGIYRKHKPFLLLGFMNAVLLWGAFGQKYPFVVLVLIYVLMTIFRLRGRVNIQTLIFIAILSILAGACEQEFLGSAYINDYFLRRVLVVPSTMLGAAENYSEQFGWNMYADTALGLFSSGARSESITFLLGLQAFKNPETNANVDFIAIAYLQFGYWGVLIESILVAGIILLLNKLFVSRGAFIAMPIALLLATRVVEQSLLIVLLSSGVFFMLVLLVIITLSAKEKRGVLAVEK